MKQCHFFNKISVIQSLGENEHHTGTKLHEDIKLHNIIHDRGLEIELLETKSKSDFIHKQCFIDFLKGDTNLLNEFAKQEGLENICGRLHIQKDVAPEKYEFHEYETDFDKEEYPKEAYAGNFRLHSGKHPKDPFISIQLRFKKEEFGKFLKHIFVAPVENKIFVKCRITTLNDSLRLGSDVQADITDFTISNYKSFS